MACQSNSLNVNKCLSISATRSHRPIDQLKHCIEAKNPFHETLSKYILVLINKKNLESSQNSAHTTTVQLWLRVQICDLIRSFEYKLKQKEFSQDFRYELIFFVRWSPMLA